MTRRSSYLLTLVLALTACGNLEDSTYCPLGVDPVAEACECRPPVRDDDDYETYRGYWTCDGVCVDTRDDDAHCGGCGDRCYTGTHCTDGVCCGFTEVSCGYGGCYDLDTSAEHCGTCGHSCARGAACVAGECQCPGTAATVCSGVCVDLGSSDIHCGACGNDCLGGTHCVGGACVCPDDQVLCARHCVDVASNASHCGACDERCAEGASCDDGACRCPDARHAVCDGACTDVLYDEATCGACGSAPCPMGLVCEEGSCECPRGTLLCDGSCVITAIDPLHCGACGVACGDDATCVHGSCTAEPPTPYVSVVSRYQPGHTLYPCCSDYDGDGEPDSGIENTGPGAFNPQNALDQMIIDDIGTRVLVFDSPPLLDEAATVPVSFTVWAADNDFDGDGAPDQPVEDRRDGYGLYQLSQRGLVAYFDGYVEGHRLIAHAETMMQPWPGVPDYPVFEVTLEGTVEAFEERWASTESDHTLHDRVVRFGDLRLSGWVPLRSVLDAWANTLSPECQACLGAPPFQIIEDVTPSGVVVRAENHELLYDCECLGGAFLTPEQLATLADVDANGDGTVDAISVGLFVTIAAATLADPAFAP